MFQESLISFWNPISLEGLLRAEQVPVLQMQDDELPLGQACSYPKIQAACKHKHSTINSVLKSGNLRQKFLKICLDNISETEAEGVCGKN